MVILPTQNPDGREADTRRNAYGFDMNRDWFARTQPETDGKVEMLRQLPAGAVHRRPRDGQHGRLLLPARTPTRSTTSSPSQAVGWINDLYGPAMQQVFDARKIPYFNYATYDLFYMGYGDTVPATGFGAAGMTFEKTNSDPTHKRVVRAVPDAVDVAVAGRGEQGRDPAGLARRAGSRPSARAPPASSSPTRSCSPGNAIEQPCPT